MRSTSRSMPTDRRRRPAVRRPRRPWHRASRVVGGSIGDVWALSLAEHHPYEGRADRPARRRSARRRRPAPGFIRLLASPLGALIVRLPLSPDRTRSILRDSGHGPSLDARPDPRRLHRLAGGRRQRHARDAARTRHGSQHRPRIGLAPGFLFEDGDLAADRRTDPARLRDGRSRRRRRPYGGGCRTPCRGRAAR